MVNSSLTTVPCPMRSKLPASPAIQDVDVGSVSHIDALRLAVRHLCVDVAIRLEPERVLDVDGDASEATRIDEQYDRQQQGGYDLEVATQRRYSVEQLVEAGEQHRCGDHAAKALQAADDGDREVEQ